MANVFLSYSREDQERAARLAAVLEAAGHQVWWDRRLTGGVEFERSIEKALAAAEVVVVAWSKSASRSHWVRDEAATGRDSDRLVAVSLDGTLPPLGFRQFHAIDLSGWDGRAPCPDVEAAVAARVGDAGGASPAMPPRGILALKRRLLPIWAWTAIAGLALLAAASGWWFTRPQAGPFTLALGRFETIGAGVEPGLPVGIEQDLRSSLGELQVPVATARADLVLNATVRRVGQSLRLVTSLDEVSSATTLWSKSIDLPAGNPAALAQDVRTVARILECGLRGARGHRRRFRSDEFVLYLRYCDVSYTGDPGQMIDAARAVTVAMPEFIGGWLGVAESVILQLWLDPSTQGSAVQAEAVAAARRAIELAPDSSDGHTLLASLMPPEEAVEREAELRRAIGLRSFRCDCAEQYLGDFLLQAGRIEDALAMYRRGLSQEPHTTPRLESLWRLATASYLSGLTNQGDAVMRRMEALFPTGLIHYRRNAALWAGRWAEAAEMFRLARPEEQAALRAAYLARQSGDAGRIAEAGAALERLTVRPRVETIMVPALAQLGRLDAAFAALEASLRLKRDYSAPGRFPGITVPMLWDPLLRPVWNDRRFPSYLQRAGFIAYWRAGRTRPDVCRAGDAPAFCRLLS